MSETIRLVRKADGRWRSWESSCDAGRNDLEVMDVVPAVTDEAPEPAEPIGIEQRVGISLSLGRYLRASDRFQTASDEYAEACKSVRKQLGANKRFVVQVDFMNYVVTSDADGNFDVERVTTL